MTTHETPRAPRVVLGMTLCNNARHLESAASSILGQSAADFALVMLDDGSEDDTEAIASRIAQTDPRVSYYRHQSRQGMVPSWREVFERATQLHPNAEYFAWVSDHDLWAPAWLETLMHELDAHAEAVMVYPLVPRIDDAGNVVDKVPRLFDTTVQPDAPARWRHFCWEGFGSGDMVYGLFRVDALRRAGVFRSVLNPDRLLVAELTLQGHVRQVQMPLWSRRQASSASVIRQRSSLFAGARPEGFWLPPSVQHFRVLSQEYRARPDGLRVSTGMRLLYLVASAWRGYRKTDVSKSFGRGIDNLHYVKKLVKKAVHVTIYTMAVTVHATRAKMRRLGRRIYYDAAMVTHKLGLRGPRKEPRVR